MELFNQLSPLYKGLFKPLIEEIKNIEKLLEKENILIPKDDNIFKAYSFNVKPKIIILGQDPYPNPLHATGLAFSVPSDITMEKLPPTLKNICSELKNNYPQVTIKTGSLENWSVQGLLLLNTRLTLSVNQELNLLWDQFTLKTLFLIRENFPEIIVISWGKNAEFLSKKTGFKNLISSPHPSPLSSYRGFFNSNPFLKSNELLKKQGKEEIKWDLI